MRLLLAKDCLRVVKLKNGEGMLASASDAREILPSLLPVSTSHIDLLNCINHNVTEDILRIFLCLKEFKVFIFKWFPYNVDDYLR